MKILTVLSSNAGRSIGDVFLALYSTIHLVNKTEPVAFLTHSNHSEIASFFRESLDLILLSDAADQHARLLDTVNIHWSPGPWEERLPHIQNPWRYFVMNSISPGSSKFVVPKAAARVWGGEHCDFSGEK